MARALAAAVAALVVGLAALACGGSDPEEPPSAPTEPPATEAAATATEPAATATGDPATEPAVTEASTPRATEAAAPEEPREPGDPDLEIVTLLPPDAIPAIDNPRFVTAEEADRQLALSDLVIGVSIDGEHRAYGAAFLSAHEIVNDTLGGRAIAVTW
ncbi:MAG: DUF3179 domain-containing protein [Dehalococcoidia bacterium]|nr:DUF3179 domain-containing protein [Dehalococcoidia bacterium]